MGRHKTPSTKPVMCDRITVDLDPVHAEMLRDLQGAIVNRTPGFSNCTQAHAIRAAIELAYHTWVESVDPRRAG